MRCWILTCFWLCWAVIAALLPASSMCCYCSVAPSKLHVLLLQHCSQQAPDWSNPATSFIFSSSLSGMNPIVLYVGHELLAGRFPIGFEVSHTHAAQLAMNLWGVTFWVLVATYLHHKGIFITVWCCSAAPSASLHPQASQGPLKESSLFRACSKCKNNQLQKHFESFGKLDICPCRFGVCFVAIFWQGVLGLLFVCCGVGLFGLFLWRYPLSSYAMGPPEKGPLFLATLPRTDQKEMLPFCGGTADERYIYKTLRLTWCFDMSLQENIVLPLRCSEVQEHNESPLLTVAVMFFLRLLSRVLAWQGKFINGVCS